MTLKVKDELLKVSFITPKIVNFHYSKNGVFNKDYSFCVEYQKLKNSNVEVNFKEDEKYYYLSSEYLNIAISKELGKVSIYDKDGNLILSDYEDKGYVKEGSKIFTYKEIKYGEAFFGFGERLGSLNKKGQVLINWNTDESNHSMNNDPLYQCHPFLFLGILRQVMDYFLIILFLVILIWEERIKVIITFVPRMEN